MVSPDPFSFIYAGDTLVGTKSFAYSYATGSTEQTMRYFHTDALGTVTAVTDSAGNVVERRSTTPFGTIRAIDYGVNNNTLENRVQMTDRSFTGH